MTRKFIGTLAATAAALGMFAGTAGADLHGISGAASTNSQFNGAQPSLLHGTCNAALANGGHSQSDASNALGYPFGCFVA